MEIKVVNKPTFVMTLTHQEAYALRKVHGRMNHSVYEQYGATKAEAQLIFKWWEGLMEAVDSLDQAE